MTKVRWLTAEETAAMYVYNDRYAAQKFGAVEFWKSLRPSEQKVVRQLVDKIIEAQFRRSAP